MTTEQVINRHLLEKANSLIEDDEPTVAMFTDPKDEVFNLKLSKDV